MAVAAAAAIRILNGEKAGDVKVAPTRFKRRCSTGGKCGGLGSATANCLLAAPLLPRANGVEAVSWQIASVVVVLLVQAGLIAVLLREHRRRQLAEAQSRQRMAELAHVIRFSTAGELTASIAHEINQPLGSIITNAETATRS